MKLISMILSCVLILAITSCSQASNRKGLANQIGAGSESAEYDRGTSENANYDRNYGTQLSRAEPPSKSAEGAGPNLPTTTGPESAEISENVEEGESSDKSSIEHEELKSLGYMQGLELQETDESNWQKLEAPAPEIPQEEYRKELDMIAPLGKKIGSGGGMGGGSGAEKKKSETKDKSLLSEFRVRSHFPEVLYFNPAIITDENGKSRVEFHSGDSISEFDMEVSAATKDGQWGRGSASFKTFQNFFIEFNPPSKLHVGDVANLKAVLFNYTDKPVSVQVWIRVDGRIRFNVEQNRTVTIEPSKAVELKFVTKAESIGIGRIHITAQGDKVYDSIQRIIEIKPSEPEARINIGGVLKKGKNEFQIDIPEKAIIQTDWVNAKEDMYLPMPPPRLAPEIWLRIYSDPSFGLFTIMDELNSEPHASLPRSIALLETVVRLKKLTETTSPDWFKTSSQYMIDFAWLRVLAFRTPDGFSIYPGDKPDIFANLVVLESMNELREPHDVTNTIGLDLLPVLQPKAMDYMLDRKNNLVDRLYAAWLLVDSNYLNQDYKSKAKSLLNSLTQADRKDLLISVLAFRIAVLIKDEGLKSSLINDLTTLFEKSLKNGYSSQSILGKWRGGGFPFAVNLILDSDYRNYLLSGSGFQSRIHENLIRILNEESSNAITRVDISMALSQMNMEQSTDKVMKSITVNGKKIDYDNLVNLSMGADISRYYRMGVMDQGKSSPLVIPLDLKPGENKISIDSEMPSLTYQVVGRYYCETARKPDSPKIDFKLPEKISDDGFLKAELIISTPNGFKGQGIIIRLPLPPGVKPVDKPKVLARRVTADYAEIRDSEIILYFKNMNPRTNTRFILPMISKINGDFYIPPPEIESDFAGGHQIAGSSSTVKWL